MSQHVAATNPASAVNIAKAGAAIRRKSTMHGYGSAGRHPHTVARRATAAYLYRPKSDTGNAPCVVMAHGWSATRDDALSGYAEAFRDAGFVVILFDYRHFGASTGEPRQLLDIRRQHDDYRAVVAWARRLGGVDPDRVVLFGTSLSGGHVLGAVAATDARIAAVISQAPFTDAIPTMMMVPLRNTVRFVVAAVRDQVGAWLGRPPVLVPAVAEPGAFGAMTAPEAKPGFDAIVPEARSGATNSRPA